MRHLKHTWTVLFLFLTYLGFSQGNTDATPDGKSNSWKSLESDEFFMQYPDTWELNETGLGGTRFIVLAPMDSDTDRFRENVGIVIQDLTNYDLDLDAYTEISENQIKTIFENCKLIESKRMRDGKGEYHVLKYSGKQGQLPLMFVQRYWVTDDHAYVLTFTSEQSNYESYKVIGENILNSFKFKNQ